MASDSAGSAADKATGHRNHFRMLQEEGLSWSGREPNTLFQNRGDGTFDEVGNVLGLFLRLDSRGAAAGDLDGDGDLDLAVYNRNNPVIKIYRNDTPGQGNVLQVKLVGAESDTLATGAQVIATCDGRRILRQVTAGSGLVAQSPSTLHFGLGACRQVDELEVAWPAGERQIFQGLPVNHRVVLHEGSDAIEAVPLAARNYNRDDLAADAGDLSAVRPELVWPYLDGSGELALAELDGDTVVLNFWATWCTACVLEMPELGELAQRFPDVRFVGISIDEGKSAAEVAAFATEHGVAYPQVWGTLAEMSPFSSLAGAPVGSVPITAVLHQGTVRAVFVGREDFDELERLLNVLQSTATPTRR